MNDQDRVRRDELELAGPGSENPNANRPRQPSPVTLHRGRPLQFGLLTVLLVTAAAAVLAGLIGAPLARARRDAMMKQNLKMIGLAFHMYHDRYGTFPPACMTDAQGKPMHSWRVILLQGVSTPEAERVLRQYDWNQPWDAPVNQKATSQMPSCYRNPLSSHGRPETDYMVITGTGALFESDRATKIARVTDGLSNTLLVAETFESGTHWAAPTDLSLDTLPPRLNASKADGGIRGAYRDHALACMGDGAVVELPATLPPETLRALITSRGGEVFSSSDIR